MAARNKPSPFSVASERFATVLRTVPVENTQAVRRNAGRHPLWTSVPESQWHQFLCKATESPTFH